MQNPQRFEFPRQAETSLEDQGKLLRSKDVAHMLDLSPDDVVELVHRGELKATKLGRLWRYRVADVQAYQRRQLSRRDTFG